MKGLFEPGHTPYVVDSEQVEGLVKLGLTVSLIYRSGTCRAMECEQSQPKYRIVGMGGVTHRNDLYNQL